MTVIFHYFPIKLKRIANNSKNKTKQKDFGFAIIISFTWDHNVDNDLLVEEID